MYTYTYIYICMCIYIFMMCEYMYTYMYIQACLSGRSQALQGAENFPGTVTAWLCRWKLGTSRALPWEVPNRTFHRSAREVRTFHRHSQVLIVTKQVCRFPKSFRKVRRKQIPQKRFFSRGEFHVIQLFEISHGAWCPRMRPLGSPIPFPTLQ